MEPLKKDSEDFLCGTVEKQIIILIPEKTTNIPSENIQFSEPTEVCYLRYFWGREDQV